MTTEHTILVTGATGTVGGEVARQLAGTSARVRALVRDPATASLPEPVEVVRGDLTDPESLEPALDGVDSVLLVWPFLTSDGADGVLDVIKRRARRVVYLSAYGAEPGARTDSPILRFHGELEAAVQASGVDWVMLRPASFAANTLGWASQVREGIVRAPFGSQARTMIHEADIAAVAVHALQDDELVASAPVLTGPDALTTAEQVQAIGEVLDLPVRYEEIDARLAGDQALAQGWPADLVEALFDPEAEFEQQRPTTAVERITGRPPRSFREWVCDHADAFGG